MGYSLTVLLVGFSHLLLRRTDRMMLGALGVAENVGIYNAAVVMSTQAALFLRSFNAIFSPMISNLHNKDSHRELSQLLKTTTKWIFALTLPIFLTFVLFSKDIMGIFGPEFRTGWAVLITLGMGQLVNASAGAVGYMLTMTGRQKLELANSLTLGILNIGLNFLFIRNFGIVGAAIATGLSLALINTVKLAEVYVIFDVHPYKISYWKPVVAGASSFALTIFVKTWIGFSGWLWLTGVVLFFVLYLVIYLTLGLDREEEVILNAAKVRMGLNSN